MTSERFERTILHQITAYCGVPAGVECFRIARRVLAAMKPSETSPGQAE